MGKQSARMWFDEYDHKDIYFDGHYHKQMYLSDENANLTLLWEKLEEAAAGFQFVWRGDAGGWFKAQGDFSIDWGDGTVEDYSHSSLTNVFPTYETNGKYTVKITGNLTDISFEEGYGLVEVLTPFPETMSSKTNFSYCFMDCEDLVSVPEDLFVNCPNATSFGMAFYGCTEFVDIPENLFSTCFNAVNFGGCFRGCLFTKIPEKLFANCMNAVSFYGCFANTWLATLPDNLFAYNTKATNFGECFYGSRIRAVPDNLFGNNEELANIKNCFAHCEYLTDVSETVFDGCPNITDCTMAFYNCQAITSAVPELWIRTNITAYEDCYYYCYNAENYSDIPSDWR